VLARGTPTQEEIGRIASRYDFEVAERHRSPGMSLLEPTMARPHPGEMLRKER
jgi:hypothetical protein